MDHRECIKKSDDDPAKLAPSLAAVARTNARGLQGADQGGYIKTSGVEVLGKKNG